MGKRHPDTHARLMLLIVLGLVLAAAAAVSAQPALAYGSFEHGTATTCTVCHTVDTLVPPTPATCTAAGCHAGFNVPAGQTNCWTCHDPGQAMSAVGPGAPATCTVACHRASDPAGTVAGTPHDPHPERGTCTQLGCHTFSTAANTANGSPHHTLQAPDPTTVNIKVSPTSIKLHKTVKATGAVTPLDLGGTVTLTVQMKKSGKFATVRTAKATMAATGKYSFTYKPAKKGTYQIRAVVKATDDFAGSKSKFVRFTVK
jgi:hypothetical protein